MYRNTFLTFRNATAGGDSPSASTRKPNSSYCSSGCSVGSFCKNRQQHTRKVPKDGVDILINDKKTGENKHNIFSSPGDTWPRCPGATCLGSEQKRAPQGPVYRYLQSAIIKKKKKKIPFWKKSKQRHFTNICDEAENST